MRVVQSASEKRPGPFVRARRQKRAPRLPRCACVAAERLEPRALLAVYPVISEADAGPGTLRQAILDSNATAGVRDTIVFAIGPGVRTIRPNSGGAGSLPEITDSVEIDATGPVSLPTQQIELSGELAPAGSDGLRITVPGTEMTTVVRGLTINRFPGNGVVMAGVPWTSIVACRIGTDVTGFVNLGNAGHGIKAESRSNAIGGQTEGARNVISGNGGDGIHVTHSATITGNYIGTAADGTTGLGNGGNGVAFRGSSGSTWLYNNIICANGDDGISVAGAPPGQYRFHLAGNRIGVDAAGGGLGNAGDGVDVLIRDAQTPVVDIGFAANPPNNFISANGGDGVRIAYTGTDPTGRGHLYIEGNYIGTAPDGITPLGNGGHGVSLTADTPPPDDIHSARVNYNTIAFNGARPEGGAGVFVAGHAQAEVRSGNIFSNRAGTVHSGLGIDLAPAGVTPNDPVDADGGPNGLQNYPQLTYARVANGTLSVAGTLHAAPSSGYTIYFYTAPAAAPFGEGSGSKQTAVRTDAAGNATFNATFAAPGVAAGHVVTATATLELLTSHGVTSEFSRAVAVTAGPAATPARFVYETAPDTITVRFNTDVSRSLTREDLVIRPVPAGDAFTPTALTYDPATNTATFTLEGGAGRPLPNGNYRATLRRDAVTDTAGVALPEDLSLDFFVLAGDTDRDRDVDGFDFSNLARSFGRTAYPRGGGADLNSDGVINSGDFAILAANFGQRVPPPPPPPPAEANEPAAPAAAAPRRTPNLGVRPRRRSGAAEALGDLGLTRGDRLR